MTDRKMALRILEALRRGPVGDSGVLVGSSGLFGFETEVPALTEDIDIVLAERGEDEAFAAEVRGLLSTVDPERLADVRAAAQSAVFSLQRDPTFSDAGAQGYASMRHQVEAGLESLSALLERLDV